MNQCVFCDIAKKRVEAEIVYETNSVLAFLDIKPINPGHTLIISKEHLVNLFDAPEDVLKDIIIAAKKISPAIMAAVKAQGINLGMNNGFAAGQRIMHCHLHLIPRFVGDKLKHWPNKSMSKSEREKIQKDILRLLKL